MTFCPQPGSRDPDVQRGNDRPSRVGPCPQAWQEGGEESLRPDFLYSFVIHPQPGPQGPPHASPVPAFILPGLNRQVEVPPQSSQPADISDPGQTAPALGAGATQTRLPPDAHVTTVTESYDQAAEFTLSFEAFHRGN